MAFQALSTSHMRGLISFRIQPREETYYLVTAEQLGAIKSNSILLQVFMLFTSLSFGGFVSVLIALKASLDLTAQATTLLQTYKTVFLVAGIAVGVITLIYLVLVWCKLRGIVTAGPIVLEASATDTEGDLPPPWV